MVSQNNEAQIVIDYFNGYIGNLLDIGANDGKTFSNSYWNASVSVLNMERIYPTL